MHFYSTRGQWFFGKTGNVSQFDDAFIVHNESTLAKETRVNYKHIR